MAVGSRCNHCTLAVLRAQAKVEGATLHVVPDERHQRDEEMPPYLRMVYAHAVNIFRTVRDESLDTTFDVEKGNYGPQWRGWMSKVSDECVCNKP
jgi:pyridoxine 5'-phosphate synthase PdxJ